MAETLTYDAGTDTVTTENNLNEDEQSSLVQGEEMEAQEEQLLAGKYKDAQELETAYKELEKKLGEKSDEVSEEVNSEKEEETEVEDVPEEETENIIDRVFEAGKNNQLNDDLLKELKGTSQEDLAKIALDLKRQNQDTQPHQLTDEDGEGFIRISGVLEAAGTAGNLGFYFGLGTTHASPSRIKAGSTFEFLKF